jgi:hypothetical protein
MPLKIRTPESAEIPETDPLSSRTGSGMAAETVPVRISAHAGRK